MSTLSWDHNLNDDGELRVNLNVMDSIEASAAIHEATYNDIPTSDLFTRTNFRNLQKATNIYDYRDRDNIPAVLTDNAGNVFRGIESIRINEVLVRAATNLYEAEGLESLDWDLGASPDTEGAITPRGAVGYLTHPGTTNNPNDEFTELATITLPDPPFDTDTEYAFKLRIRVRNDGEIMTDEKDRGFRVWVTNQVNSDVLVIDSRLSFDSGATTDPPYPVVNLNDKCRWSAAAPASSSLSTAKTV